MSEPTIRVLTVDDHRMFAQSLAGLLSREDDIDVVGTEADGESGVRRAQQAAPDVAIVDVDLPDAKGPDVARRMLLASPSTKVIMLTGSTDEKLVLQAIEAGCAGFLTKDRAFEELAAAIRLVAAGESYIPTPLLAGVLAKLRAEPHGLGSDLSRRELEILGQLREGASTTVIAESQFISISTVRNHVQNILTKLGAHSRIEAVAIATREGLFD